MPKSAIVMTYTDGTSFGHERLCVPHTHRRWPGGTTAAASPPSNRAPPVGGAAAAADDEMRGELGAALDVIVDDDDEAGDNSDDGGDDDADDADDDGFLRDPALHQRRHNDCAEPRPRHHTQARHHRRQDCLPSPLRVTNAPRPRHTTHHTRSRR